MLLEVNVCELIYSQVSTQHHKQLADMFLNSSFSRNSMKTDVFKGCVQIMD